MWALALLSFDLLIKIEIGISKQWSEMQINPYFQTIKKQFVILLNKQTSNLIAFVLYNKNLFSIIWSPLPFYTEPIISPTYQPTTCMQIPSLVYIYISTSTHVIYLSPNITKSAPAASDSLIVYTFCVCGFELWYFSVAQAISSKYLQFENREKKGEVIIRHEYYCMHLKANNGFGWMGHSIWWYVHLVIVDFILWS